MTDAILSLKDVGFRWPGRAGFSLSVPALSVAKGETVLLLGESGSGKSTLLSLICGTVLPDRGTIMAAGRDVTNLSGGARDKFRAEQIGVIFQQFNLLPFGSVSDNILLPLRFAPERRKRAGDAPVLRLAVASLFARALTVGMTILAIALSVALFLGVEMVLFRLSHRQCHQQRHLGKLSRYRGAARR